MFGFLIVDYLSLRVEEEVLTSYCCVLLLGSHVCDSAFAATQKF